MAGQATVDPFLARVEATYEGLPAVPQDRLHPEALRGRFVRPPVWAPEVVDDRIRLNSSQGYREAAVLIGVVTRPNGPSVLLTQRTAHLRRHAGQVAFPGGRAEPSDGSPAATALREAHEEVGLDPDRVEVLGLMPEYRTGTGYAVTPVVALVDPAHDLVPDPNEVAQAFEVPLSYLMDPANHQRRSYQWQDAQRWFYAMPWRDPDPGRGEYLIWGATAGMLRNLYRLLSA